MSTKKKKIDDHILDRLGHALDLLAGVLIEVGGLPDELPGNGEALDAALNADDQYTESRRAFADALSPLLTSQPKDSYLVEELGNAMVAQAAGAGFRLGVRMGLGRRDD